MRAEGGGRREGGGKLLICDSGSSGALTPAVLRSLRRASSRTGERPGVSIRAEMSRWRRKLMLRGVSLQ